MSLCVCGGVRLGRGEEGQESHHRALLTFGKKLEGWLREGNYIMTERV